MTRGRQSSRETGFSFHEISKASRRPPGTRTGEFIKIETRHLCRKLRIRWKSVLRTTHTYSSSSRLALRENWDIERSGSVWNKPSRLILDNRARRYEFFARWHFKIFKRLRHFNLTEGTTCHNI